MGDEQKDMLSPEEPALIVGAIRNIGEPLNFTNVEPLAGFSAESGIGGQQIKVWTKLSFTFDDPKFYCLVENLENVIKYMAELPSLRNSWKDPQAWSRMF